MTALKENLEQLEEAISVACRAAGRARSEVELMAVSKTHPAQTLMEAASLGLTLFGENRVQEFAGKSAALANLAGAEWHMIGHLQTNKSGKAVELFNAVDSVDSVKLSEKLNAAAQALGKKLAVLIEINVGGEAAKSGVAARSAELEALLQAVPRLESLSVRGLMTVPPFTDDPEGARPYFRTLRELRDAISGRKLPGVSMDVLSMGMSHDFGVAIDEGSTCVRVGTAIFGERE